MPEATDAGGFPERLVIWPRRWTVVVMVLVALAFVVGGAILIWCGEDIDVPEELTLTVGIAAMTLGLAFGALQIHRLFSPHPALVLDREGLTDHTSAAGAGFLPWSEITGVRVYTAGRNSNVVGITLRDHSNTLSKRSTVVRLLVRTNLAIGYAPVNISENGLPISAQKLAEEIERFRKAAASASAPAAPAPAPPPGAAAPTA